MTTSLHSTQIEPNDRVDVQIVGGGLAGLLAALDAAQRGLTVRLYDHRPAGGRARTAGHEGFHLNQGPHAVYVGGALDRTLGRLGIQPTGSAPALSGGQGRIGDTQGLLPQGPMSMLRSPLLSAGDKARMIAVMARLPRIDTAALGDRTVEEYVHDLVGDGDVATVVKGLITLSTYNRAHDRASADAAMTNLKMAASAGVRYLDHGWQQIVDELEKRCVATGNVDRVDEAVRAVEADRLGWVCHTDQGTRSGRRVVVAAGSPAVADRLLGTDNATIAGPAVHASVLDVGLEGRPPMPFLLGLDTGLYASLHSVAAGLAPAGQSLVSVMKYLAPGADADRAELDQHRRNMGIADDDVTMTRYLHRLCVTWGMPEAARGGLAGRPAVEVADRPGAFLAGDWVGSSGLLADASAASASTAVARIAEDLK